MSFLFLLLCALEFDVKTNMSTSERKISKLASYIICILQHHSSNIIFDHKFEGNYSTKTNPYCFLAIFGKKLSITLEITLDLLHFSRGEFIIT